MNPARVILVDDHSIVRRGLAVLINGYQNYEVVAEANDGEQALSRMATTPVDVALLDLYMPRMGGMEAIRRIRRDFPQVKVVVLSMYDDEQFVAQALQAGAHGYLLKQDLDLGLLEALDKVMGGGTYTSPAIDLAHVDRLASGRLHLTDREREVLQLIVDGHTTNDMASIMSISPHTAVRHRANLMQKLNVHTQMELVQAAVDLSLVVLSKPPLPSRHD